MADDAAAINPKPIISLMFGVSVGFWANTLAQYFKPDGKGWVLFESTKDTTERVETAITLASGILFLLDLLCIVWWYARYIYRIQPNASFGTYFLDFVICSMFALAANSWTVPSTFLFATFWGSVFLVVRFWLLYKEPNTSLTDKRILMRAGLLLGVALMIALIGFGAIREWFPMLREVAVWDGHALPGILSAIGIGLTVYLKNKIDVAVDIYTGRYATLAPVHLLWPGRDQPGGAQRTRVRHGAKAGLERFDELFRKLKRHDRIQSRVHSETDLLIQSYILAVPSCEREEYADEIEMKACMVAVSHWLDDLVDGRNEVFVCKRLREGPRLSDDPGAAGELFRQIYRPLIVRYTERSFYDALYGMICKACVFPWNQKYLFLGLNRVAYGSVIFSPKIPESQRRSIMDAHNVFLKDWNVEHDEFTNAVEALLDEIVAAGDSGGILLGLTTKTVQELAMSSENHQLDVGLSILFSILYAPLIYYHNISEELQNNEMVPLLSFDTDSDLWVPWLKEARDVIDMAADKGRHAMRLQQIRMAYRCFRPRLPEFLRDELQDVYDPQAL